MSRKVHWATACLTLLAITTSAPFQAVADEGPPAGSVEGTLSQVNDNTPPLFDDSAADDLDALLDLDLGEVARVRVTAPSLEVEVTTVSRKKSTVGRSPAAVFVITSDMIRRSGAASLPEVLRMAPGVQVARITSHQWAISIRGFSGLYSNKVQVQIDGRSIYTQFFGGVIWSAHSLPLTEVERIEVIRGPGASVWGANAVNGIINVITKDASTTEGFQVRGGGGSYERGFTNIQYGREIADGTFVRVFGNWADQNHGQNPTGVEKDDWRIAGGGFRIDSQLSANDKVTFQGSYFDTEAGIARTSPNVLGPPFTQAILDENDYVNGNLLLRWQHEINSESSTELQVFYDHSELDAPFTAAGPDLLNRIDTFDIDFQHQLQLNDRHSLVWGLGYRYAGSTVQSATNFLDLAQPSRDFHRISGFIQDEVTIRPDEWYFTLGVKMLDNSFSGFEVQPTARVLWLPDDRHSVWASVSRAVRLPTFFDVDGSVTLPPIRTTPVAIFPGQVPALTHSGQDLMAYEMGVRGQPADEISWDAAFFINRYDNLGVGTVLPLAPVPGNPLAFRANQQRGHGGSAESYGSELTATIQAAPWMKVTGSYSYLRIFGTTASVKGAPVNQLYLQSSIELSPTVECDIIWRYVDSVPEIVSHYNVMDLRVAWHPAENVEWAVVGQNLLDASHPESGPTPTGGVQTEVPAGVYTVLTLKL